MVMNAAAIVAAAGPHRGIGLNNQLPWRIPADLKHFSRVTKGNAVIMGRKTWESLPEQYRPLPERLNVVLSRRHDLVLPDGVLLAKSWDDAFQQCRDAPKVFVMGGADIYQQALEQNYVHEVICTEVNGYQGKCDAFFPELCPDEWEKEYYYDQENSTGTVNDLEYTFWKYSRRRNEEELQYLQLCQKILQEGNRRGDRTGTGTVSLFGAQMRFSLRDGRLPLLTTKRTFWRGVAEELLWFIQGNTNANDLAAKNIHIWDGNGSREFLDQLGLTHRQVGDLGPVYGFQWRHFGAEYKDMHADYTGQGIDQLADCIDKIKNHPEDRRIVLTAWNPKDLPIMALPPCHMFCQFYVDIEKNELSCQLYQRSADMGLGVPFNIASYALLTHMIAQVTGRKPGEFVHVIGDAHIYLNHVDALKEQLEREPRPFPKLKINPEKTHIDDFEFSDFEVVGYHPHKAISMKMAV
ncbi:dihydrofolate reductase / thymidylate synthase [Fistulifera solaris]|uniref:Bifunctional dihydrofolate reductase-thymidylate synthase n=1 Tax=Fistulifera solaris TaxID=1519565 RepID=A0A1Z5JMC2_FISSO|nr:dihydrofolate reductase / thymidylate synthase [Fistulifera solaris]|eukprot:GAX15155.1 dihydrofolate reductase / thymidylate synthase [Fistulifera solaris]